MTIVLICFSTLSIDIKTYPFVSIFILLFKTFRASEKKIMTLNSSSTSPFFLLKCANAQFKYGRGSTEVFINQLAMIMNGTIALPTIILNSLAFIVFSRRQMLQVTTNILLLANCVTDFLNGLVSIPFTIAKLYMGIQQTKKCFIFITVVSSGQILSWVAAILTFLASVDRYLAVFYPYRYGSYFKDKAWLYYTCCLLAYIFPISLVVASYLDSVFNPILYLTALVPILIGTSFYINLRITRVIYKINGEIQRQSRTSKPPNSDITIVNSHKCGSSTRAIELQSPTQPGNIEEQSKMKYSLQRKNTTLIRKEERSRQLNSSKKATKVAFLMVCTLIICYTPYLVIISIWQVRWVRESKYPTSVQYTTANITGFFIYLKSCINPIIYMYAMPTVRKKMYQILTFRCNE